MEFRADLIDLKSIISKEEPDIIPTESIGDLARSYEGRFHLLRQVGLLRRLCRPYAERYVVGGRIKIKYCYWHF